MSFGTAKGGQRRDRTNPTDGSINPGVTRLVRAGSGYGLAQVPPLPVQPLWSADSVSRPPL